MKASVLLVAHDAGGAEILSAWLTINRAAYQVQAALAGPAVRVFQRDHPGLTAVPLSCLAGLGRDDLVLTGSSLEADWEREAIALAKKYAIPCVTFLDHWDLYRERFGDADHWLAGLPDEVWVGDRYGYDYALQQGLPEEKLRLVANPYLELLPAAAVAGDPKPAERTILYICEPISRKLAATFGEEACLYHDELQLMDDFLAALLAHRGEFARVTIRLHPYEASSKYEPIVKRYREQLPLSYSSRERLLDDLLAHAMVVGIESNALVVAAHLQKPVYSCITGQAWRISLPHREIRRINSFHQIFSTHRESV